MRNKIRESTITRIWKILEYNINSSKRASPMSSLTFISLRPFLVTKYPKNLHTEGSDGVKKGRKGNNEQS